MAKKHMRAPLKALALVGAVMLTTVACGGGNDTSESPSPTTPPATRGANGELVLSTMLSTTGALASYGPGNRNAVEFAVDEINKAGGVLGKPVQLEANVDDATDPDVASSAIDRIIADSKVEAMIGPMGSNQTAAILDKTVGAGLFVCSSSNTADTLTERDNKEFYMRTAPPDSLQAPVLANLITRDGNGSVAIAYRTDDYGKGLSNALESELEKTGAQVSKTIAVDPNATDFAADVDSLVSAKADANVLLLFPQEGAKFIATMQEKGIGPAQKPTYGADGMRADTLGQQVSASNPNIVDGMKGTAAGTGASASFTAPFAAAFPQAAGVTYTPQAYDCANIIALAIQKAGSVDPKDWKSEVQNVTKEGATECTTFADCMAKLQAGGDINYVGAAGPFAINDKGNPTEGTYEEWEYKNAVAETIGTQKVDSDGGVSGASPTPSG